MKRPFPQSLNRLFSGSFARFIVILFVGYVGVDITNPQLCSEEFAPAPFLLASSVEGCAEAPLTDRSIDRQEPTEQREESSAPHSEDDCFCCCAHVLPGLTTHPNGAPDIVSQGLTLTTQAVTSAHLVALYHPPRTV
jgi:hypothetical protein